VQDLEQRDERAAVGAPARPVVDVDRRFRVRGALLGVCVGALLYVVVGNGWLGGGGYLCAAAALCLLPSSSSFARRVALNGSLLIGASPVLWWVEWPVPLDHGALLLALSVAWLVFVTTSSPSFAAGCRALLPTWRRSDWLVVVAALAGLVATRRWAFPGSSREALTTLLPGIDNVAHFQIFSTMRAEGASIGALGRAGDGGTWAFDFYPSGFHALVATLADLASPASAGDASGLAAYTQGVSAVVVLGMLVLVGSIVSLPRLGDRPLIALPVVTLSVMAYLWEPGQKALADGFALFWLACLAAACAVNLSIDARRSRTIVQLLAVGALLVAVGNTWAPLLMLVAPTILLLQLDGRWGRRPHLPSWAWPVIVVGGLLVIAAILKASLTLVRLIDLRFLVTEGGGFTGTSPLPVFVMLVLATYVGLALPGWVRTRGGAEDDRVLARRVRLLVLTPLVAVASLTALLVAQLRLLGTTSYYLWKYMMGVELILAGFVPAVAGILVAVAVVRARRRSAAIAAGLAATVVATQVYAPFPWGEVGLRAHPGGTASVGDRAEAHALADGILAAVGTSTRRSSFDREYVALGPHRGAEAFYADAWYHAIFASSTSVTGARLDQLRVRVVGVDDVDDIVATMLDEHADVEVVVPPAYVAPLRARMNSPEHRSRIVSWR
jgi:hypothetical protein